MNKKTLWPVVIFAGFLNTSFANAPTSDSAINSEKTHAELIDQLKSESKLLKGVPDETYVSDVKPSLTLISFGDKLFVKLTNNTDQPITINWKGIDYRRDCHIQGKKGVKVASLGIKAYAQTWNYSTPVTLGIKDFIGSEFSISSLSFSFNLEAFQTYKVTCSYENKESKQKSWVGKVNSNALGFVASAGF